jgi:hypothetical protein
MRCGESSNLEGLCRAALSAGLLALAACSTPTILENSATAVTVRYDGLAHKIDDATQTAQRAYAARRKAAQLRKIDDEGLGQHFAHFDCV